MKKKTPPHQFFEQGWERDKVIRENKWKLDKNCKKLGLKGSGKL